MNLIDLYILLPYRKKLDKNHSSNIYNAFGNRSSFESKNKLQLNDSISHVLDYLIIKLNEKFGSLSESFLWFDISHSGQLKFCDF